MIWPHLVTGNRQAVLLGLIVVCSKSCTLPVPWKDAGYWKRGEGGGGGGGGSSQTSAIACVRSTLGVSEAMIHIVAESGHHYY